MQRNLLHYQRALFLRVKKGYSYAEIMEELPVAKSTLSGWLSGIELSAEHQARIRQKQEDHWNTFTLGEWNRAKRQKEIAAIRVQAKSELGNLSERELFLSGIMLYWAEGDKTGKTVGISNADPSFHLFMMHWFRNCLHLPEDKFYAAIHYHKGQDYHQIEKYWSHLTGISLSEFGKPFCKPPGTGHRKHYLQWGTLRVRIRRSADLLHQILGWKEGLIEQSITGIK